MFASILHGFLIGFLFPLLPWFFFKDQPLPNFFDAEAEADQRARREEAAVRAEEERRAAIHATAMGLAPPPVVPDAPPIEGSEETASVSARVSNSPLVGGEVVSSVAFGKRTQVSFNACSHDKLTPDWHHSRHPHQPRVRSSELPWLDPSSFSMYMQL